MVQGLKYAYPANKEDTSWQRSQPGLGVWEHRGKVAIVGVGQSYIDRRWDGKDMTKSCGAKAMEAIRMALDDAGLTMDDIDGLFSCQAPDTRAEQTWAPRPYFAPPYDTEDGILMASPQWINKQMGGFKNVKYMDNNAGTIWTSMPTSTQAVGDGKCHTALVWYPMCNLEGRYGQNNPVNVAEEARGNNQFTLPWGYQSGAMFNNLVAFLQYCKKYGSSHDALTPFALNNRRNGLMVPWGYYALHEPYQLTAEDYKNGRLVEEPLVVYDCDRPIMTCAAWIVTTAERAKTMKQPPIYVLGNANAVSRRRSTMFTIEEFQQECRQVAQVLYEASGLSPKDLDIFNPYDGYLTFPQQYLEGFQWHGVGWGEAHDFYAGDISVEGPHPYLSSGGNNGTGRNRFAHYWDCIVQLRGTAGKRQVKVKAETGAAGYPAWTMFCKYSN